MDTYTQKDAHIHAHAHAYVHISKHTHSNYIIILMAHGSIFVVNGGWSSWTCEACSKTCGGGTQRCTRSCNRPTPSCGGKDCPGSSVNYITCNSICCPGKRLRMYNILYFVYSIMVKFRVAILHNYADDYIQKLIH